MKPNNPYLPSHPNNPVGQVARFRAASKRLNKDMVQVRKWLKQVVEEIPKVEITANTTTRGEQPRSYGYLIDRTELARIIEEIRARLGDLPSDYVVRLIRDAYEDGTLASVVNLAHISEDYTRDITQVLSSQPWQRRVGLIESRVFEEMSKFTGDLATNLGRVLSNAVSNGSSASQAAASIDRVFKTGRSDAMRIARTEMTTAYRRARWDEAQDAQSRLGLRTALMHLSARSPTTRDSHWARHGLVYTVQQVREWYSEGANAINCKCSQVEVLVDENGVPLDTDFVAKIRAQSR